MYRLIPHVIRSWTIGEYAAIGTWLPPIYPFKTWILLGVILLILQGIAEFLKYVYMAVTNTEIYAEKTAEEKALEEAQKKLEESKGEISLS